MIIRYLAVAALAALPLVSHAQLSAEGEQAKARLFKCYGESIVQLDDGVSDVTTVARAVVSTCQAEFDNFIYSVVSGNRRVDVQEVSRRVKEGHVEMIVPSLLKLRAGTL